MKKYIDANALYDTIDELNRYDDFEDTIIVGDALQTILDAPAADVQEVKHGKWIDKVWIWECSVCKKRSSYGKTDYCPNCGAKMDAKEYGNG